MNPSALGTWVSAVQDGRAQLSQWGVTYEVLYIVGALALVMFFFSLREVVVWYLRIGQLHQQMRALHEQLTLIRQTLENAKIELPMTGTDGPEKDNPKRLKLKKFNLDH